MDRIRLLKTAAAVVALLAWTGATGRAETFYSGSNNSTLIAIDTGSGVGQVIGSFGSGGVFAGAFNPAGTFYIVTGTYGSTTRLATVNLQTGQATTVATLADSGIDMLVFSRTGTLYASSGGSLSSMNAATGALTPIGSFGGENMMMDLAFDNNGTLYGIASEPTMSNPSRLYTINTGTGAATPVTTFSQGCMMSLAVDSSNNFFATDFCHANTPFYKLDIGAGTASVVGLSGLSQLHGGDIQPVPKPAAWALVAAGFLIAAGGARLRRRT